MTLGEFRKLTKDLPDDYEIVTTGGDAVWYEVDFDGMLPSTDAYVGIVTLLEGQEVTEQHWIPARLGMD